MLPDIHTGLQAVLASQKRTFPQSVNRVSSMDDPCLRRLYYRRAAWDKAAPTPDSLQGVFSTGNILEPVVERIISEVGHASTPRWRIVGSQTPTNDTLLKKYNISGSIDGFLQVYDWPNGGNWAWNTIAVADIKTMSPNIYPQINCYADLARYPWTRGYRGQLMLYALAHNLELCVLLLCNKGNLYDMKFVEFPIDMEYLEGLLQKAETVNVSIECNEPPAGVNDPAICQRCQWFSYCAPDLTIGSDTQFLDNAELESILDRMEELTPQADEYSDLEKTRDAMLRKGQNCFIGNWLITWKETSNHQWRKKTTKINAVQSAT
jgi:hypothetical protein